MFAVALWKLREPVSVRAGAQGMTAWQRSPGPKMWQNPNSLLENLTAEISHKLPKRSSWGHNLQLLAKLKD
jgi:hypothetical protein